jgi:nucleoside-diphosphate-sugar epimerase
MPFDAIFSTMSKVLILGGSGFLSGTMARRALGEGHEVWTVTRGQKPMKVQGVHSIVADRKNRPEFAAAIEKSGQTWDLVVDCIGYSADDAKQDVEVFAQRTKHLVFISTDFVLSPFDRPWQVDETYSKFNDTPYGTGKKAAEDVLLDFVRKNDPSTMRVTILRPCHIYGPGSLLGVIPKHGRDTQLIDRIKRGETLTLLGGGFFLQQPVFAEDLWEMSFSCLGNAKAHGQIYFSPGPETVEARVFYHLIAEILGTKITIDEISMKDFLREQPDQYTFCAHRVYSTVKARDHGLKVPTTKLREGLRKHVESML